eukprot:764584-Hanusia_phi.AAC.2
MKYATLGEALQNYIIDLEEFNQVSNIEISRFIEYEKLLKIRDNLEQIWIRDMRNYSNHLDMLLLSMYVLTYPNRKEIMTLRIIKSEEEDDYKGDFVLINDDMKNGYYILNTIKKKHDRIKIKLSPQLTKLLKESIRIYPRKYVMTDVRDYTKMRECFNRIIKDMCKEDENKYENI